jgi:hypothetical protein
MNIFLLFDNSGVASVLNLYFHIIFMTVAIIFDSSGTSLHIQYSLLLTFPDIAPHVIHTSVL